MTAIHTFTRAMWIGQNEVLHNEKDTVDAKMYSE